MLRLTEIYTSIQGEGPKTGQSTTFVRFAGCNMRCPGWPCDTEFAIEPKLYLADGASFKVTPEQLFDKLPLLGPKRICLTGGEPFVQPNIDLQQFVELATAEGYGIECFTNGSFELPIWAMQSMSFVMDWKLGSSGESETALEQRFKNAIRLRRFDSIKFVVADQNDITSAASISTELLNAGCEAQFWVGAVWGKYEPKHIADVIVERNLSWRLNLQTHKYIWDPDDRRV